MPQYITVILSFLVGFTVASFVDNKDIPSDTSADTTNTQVSSLENTEDISVLNPLGTTTSSTTPISLPDNRDQSGTINAPRTTIIIE